MHLSRTTKVLFLLPIFLVGLVLLLPVLSHPQHFVFRHRSASYYSDFTKACDSLLAQHPLGTNQFIEISVTDPSLPKIIRDVNPFKIKVAPDWVWIVAWGSGHASGAGITWEPQYQIPNSTWVLSTTVESHSRVVYVENRHEKK
jgi:hypothetical protein